MLAHILYSTRYGRLSPCHQIFPPFIHSLPTTRVPRAELTPREKGREGGKKIKIKKNSHVPADKDRDSIRAECSRRLTRERFATEMMGEGLVFAIGMKIHKDL